LAGVSTQPGPITVVEDMYAVGVNTPRIDSGA
jgi:hypothetical protein